MLSGAHFLPAEIRIKTLLNSKDQDLTLSISDNVVKEKYLRGVFYSTTPTLTPNRMHIPLEVFAG